MAKLLIIGASKGIGAAIAAITQVDFEVISISRSQPIEAVTQHYQCDILQDLLPTIEGPLAGLIYCPGSISLKPFASLKSEDFREDLEINLIGAVRCLRHFQSNLQASDSAAVVLFSSVAAHTGMNYHASIATAKGAVEGLTRALAAEWAPKIRVNAIAPSLTRTGLSERIFRDEHKIAVAAARHPLKRIGEPEDIAQLAAFLVSAKASWMTGQILHVDGGLSAIN